MKKVTFKIEGKEYEVALEEEFADFLNSDLHRYFHASNSSIKTLLQAYLSRSYECYKLQKRLNEIIRKLDS